MSKLKFLQPFAVAVVMALGVAAIPKMSFAATCQFGTLAEFTATADVYTSTACVGEVAGNDSAAYLNTNTLFGSTDWVQDTKINVLETETDDGNGGTISTFSFLTANPDGRLTATLDVDDALSGTWAVDNWTGISKAVLVLKGGNGFAAYLLDMTAGLSGGWVTQALTVGSNNNQPALSHVSLYTSVTAPVPIPAAGILLISALGGLGFAARRRRKAS